MTRRIFPILLLVLIPLFLTSCRNSASERAVWTKVTTFAGFNREFGEPFGLAFDKAGVLYVSDGEKGAIFRIIKEGKIELVTDKLNTPSHIVFDAENNLIVADSGSHSIKKIDVKNGNISIVAGVDGKKGFADGAAGSALFNAPVGIAIFGSKIFVADTYNDKIRVIENGNVSTVAGSAKGFAEGLAAQAKFDTPCGIAVLPGGEIIVADAGNRRIRLIERNGNVGTLAGMGEQDSVDGSLLQAKFVQPLAVVADKDGAIFIADGNSIRAVGRKIFPFVETISHLRRGFSDSDLLLAKVNRPSSLTLDGDGNLFFADAENQTVRVFSDGTVGRKISRQEIENLRYKPEEFRALGKPRWTYDPPEAKRDVAGTLGEIRGEITEGKQAWFHNGLDIAGSLGETAKFIRDGKVLQPVAAEDFGNLRERLRLADLGYIHIRLGRDKNQTPFADERFQFSRDEQGKLNGVRVPRGTKFSAGEAVGTLNPFNHVHLIAGRVGEEMNALDALIFPNLADTTAPTIEKISLFKENWSPVETQNSTQRINLQGKTRIVVRAFDRIDGNAAYRKLGVYEVGYQVLNADKSPVVQEKTTISFAKMPDENFVRFVYAPGSQSGYTPQTIFDYVATNEVSGDTARENLFDANILNSGNYILRVFASDFFGNKTEKDIMFEVRR